MYLEDFLELVEQLPTDFKHNFAQLRSLDLRAQSQLRGRCSGNLAFFALTVLDLAPLEPLWSRHLG